MSLVLRKGGESNIWVIKKSESRGSLKAIFLWDSFRKSIPTLISWYFVERGFLSAHGHKSSSLPAVSLLPSKPQEVFHLSDQRSRQLFLWNFRPILPERKRTSSLAKQPSAAPQTPYSREPAGSKLSWVIYCWHQSPAAPLRFPLT